MFIVKVRDHVTPRTYEVCPTKRLALFLSVDNQWKSCVIRYGTLELAKHYIELSESSSKAKDNFGIVRDYRIFELVGRKQNLVFEKLAEQEG